MSKTNTVPMTSEYTYDEVDLLLGLADPGQNLAADPAAAARESEAIEAQTQQMRARALLAELPDAISAGYEWGREILAPDSQEVVSSVRLGGPSGLSLGHSAWHRAKSVSGETVYLHSFGNAWVLHASRAVVERAWSLARDSRGLTPERCEEWLSKYGPEGEIAQRGEGCAGWELRAFTAGRQDLLDKYLSGLDKHISGEGND